MSLRSDPDTGGHRCSVWPSERHSSLFFFFVAFVCFIEFGKLTRFKPTARSSTDPLTFLSGEKTARQIKATELLNFHPQLSVEPVPGPSMLTLVS